MTASEPSPASPEFDRRVIRRSRGCPNPPIRKIIVYKDRQGNTPLSPERLEMICTAARLALTEASRVAAALDQVWFQRWPRKGRKRRRAWRRVPAFVRFWGNRNLSSYQIHKVRRRAKKLLRRLRKGITFVVIHHDDPGRRNWKCFREASRRNARAYSYGGSSRIYLCPTFFSTHSDPDQQAQTIIHELAHVIGHTHKRIGGNEVASQFNDEALALRLARDRPKRARRNPANFALVYDAFRGSPFVP